MSQTQPTQSTKNGTSNSSKQGSAQAKAKKKARPPEDAHLEKGNKDFVLPPEGENHDFDPLELINDEDPIGKVQKKAELSGDDEVKSKDLTVKKKPETIEDLVEDYEAAETIRELKEQVEVAQMHKLPWVEAVPAVVEHFAGNKDSDYFLYAGITVFKAGRREKAQEKMNETMRERLFGKAKG